MAESLQETLLKTFTYDAETGNLYWKIRPSNNVQAGQLIKTRCRGYLVVNFQGKLCKTHRLIWYMIYGKWPDQIDHINRVRDDNRLCNLREVTAKENSKNRINYRISQEMIEMLKNSSLPASQLAIQTGVSKRYINELKRGKYRA